ncbi:MAG: glycoside hydrolase family 19 protein [Collimonas sp.]|uniref:glycoside hydrolase family 19 protein n=1 Tax=Collimonas sp. TaxID=1963772 RepID=UPI003263F6E1
MISAAQIAASTGAKLTTAQTWLNALSDAMADFDINTPARQAAFLAQIGHESGGLVAVVENLNYGAAGLLATFGSRFTPATAQHYARKPENIANHVYALRNGNGPESSGDGWNYRGRGPIQLTGLRNYAVARDRLRKLHGTDVPDFVSHPEAVEQPEWGAACAAMYWQGNGCNALADLGNIDAITRAINGPAMAGKEERRALWVKAKATLGVK